MNETERLILENQKVMMNAINFIMINNTSNSGEIQGYIIDAHEKTEKALAPQSQEMSYEKDIQEGCGKTFAGGMCGVGNFYCEECSKKHSGGSKDE